MPFVTLLLLAAALLVPAAHAQSEPDTTAAHRYFPLQVGNRWEYTFLGSAGAPWPQPIPPLEPRGYWRWLVTGEAVVNGTSYVTLRRESYSLSGQLQNATEVQVRYDTLSARVVQPSGIPFPMAPCAFNLPFYTGDSGCVDGYRGMGGYTADVLGVTTTVKRFTQGIGLDNVEYAAGIGLLRTFVNLDKGNAQSDLILNYALVGGRRYGSPLPMLPVVVAAEPDAAQTGLTLGASPNPTAGPLTLSLALPEAGAVTIDVFDALGRRVHHDTDERPAGTQVLHLDTSPWAPGLYVVRAVAGGETALLRIARH